MRRAIWALAAVALLPAGCRPEESGATASDELLGMEADQVIVGMKHTLIREGLRRGLLLADTAYFFDDDSEVHLRGVTATFHDDEGEAVSVLTSSEGVLRYDTEDMEATGNVVVRDLRRDQRLETEYLRYRSAEDQISTDRAFALYRDRGGTVYRGEGFVSDPGMDSVSVTQPSGRSRGVERPFAPPAAPDTATPEGSPEEGTPADTSGIAGPPADEPDSLVAEEPRGAPAPEEAARDTLRATRNG